MSNFLARIVRRGRALVGGERVDRELDDEVRLHIEMEADDLMRTRGLEPGEARRRALVAFGGVSRHTEAHRDARGVRWIEELVQDLRYAVRGLVHSPVFSLSAVAVLALGIGSTTAVFSAVTTILLDSRDERLVRIFEQDSPTNRWPLSTVDFQAIVAQQRSFSAVGAVRPRRFEVSTPAGSEPQRTGWATSGFWRAVGVTVARGRGLEAGDDRVGAPRVALVGHAYAARTFSGDANAVGQNIVVDGIPHTVVGVLPAGISELAGVAADIWPALQLEQPQRRGPFGLNVIGRLAPGATVATARSDLAGISERIFPIWAAAFQDRAAKFTPVPLRDIVIGDVGRMLGVFAAAVALVLLIAVANVASLMLVRATGRWREVSLRTVLGATRGRLVRMLATEIIVLAGAGAAAGILVGGLALHMLVAVGPYMPRLAEATLDGRAVCFAAGIAILSGIIVGTYPASLLLRADSAPALRSGDREIGAGRGTQAVRAAFVVSEFALALPLLAGAALLLNSFVRLQRVDPGFDPRRLLTVRVFLPSGRYLGDTAISTFWARALPRVRELPGVIDAGLGSEMPPSDVGNENNFDLIDRPVPRGKSQPTSPWPTVSADYFSALGVPLLDGRRFMPGDSASAPPVVIVSRSWARHYFPDGHVVGRQLISGGCTQCPKTTVVGVVGDVKYAGLGGTGDAVYDPLTAGWLRSLNLFVQVAGSPNEAAGRVRDALRSVDPGMPLDIAPMQDRLYASVTQPRHWTVLLGGFAAAALVLAAIGIFGMLSYTVSARRREIGVRIALGARQNAVVAMIVRRGMVHAVVGATLGLVVALAATRLLGSALFDVSATDPLTLTAATLLLLGVAFVACWLPARRAAAIDPVETIRAE